MSAKDQVDGIRQAQHGKASTRVPGHSMTWGGECITGPFGVPTRQRVGVTYCSCGAKSPEFDSKAKRQTWHRQHKIDVLTSVLS